ncbi:MAG TPA: translation elongation factor-like protein [Archaeoglobaceae archaeon]|nr:translation elongation factor-like protein [Archaeoglobaceae archaeon]
MEEVGRISHYFNRIGVAAVVLKKPLKVGDRIRIKGSKTDFEQIVESMEINNKKVDTAMPGDEVGIKVMDKVRKKDIVYRLD